MLKSFTDIVIIGGGLTGSSLACALGKSGLFSKITLLDQIGAPAKPSSQVPGCTLTLTPMTQKFMESVNSWERLDQSRIGYFSGIQVWDYFGKSSMNFDSTQGYVVEKDAIANASMAVLSDLPSVEVKAPAKIKQFTHKDTSIVVELDSGEEIEGALVVGADGKDSFTRKFFDFNAWRSTYPHIGLTCSVQTDTPIQSAYQRFLSTGPLAIFPLWDNFCSISWSLPPYEAEKMAEISDEGFLNALNKALTHPFVMELPFGKTVIPPTISSVQSKRITYSYSLLQACPFAKDRVALIGDAAHTVHPMAEQGHNLGVYDAINLACLLCEAAKVGKDLGADDILNKYSRFSRAYNGSVAVFEQGMIANYTDLLPMHLFRNFKYAVIDQIGPLKQLFTDVGEGKYFVYTDWDWQ